MTDDSMPPANLILQALHGIRSDLKITNERLESVAARVEEGFVRLDGGLVRLENRLERLEKRTTEGFLATNTKLAALTETVMQHDRRLDHLLTNGLGAEVRDLRVRVTRIESGRVARVGKPGKKKPGDKGS